MMSDLATAVVWSGIQVSIFAVIVAAIVLAIRKWMGGLVREILTASMALIILFTLLPVFTASFPGQFSIPSWFSVASLEQVREPEPVVVHSQPAVVEPTKTIRNKSTTPDPLFENNEPETEVVAAPWMNKVAEFWEQMEQTPIEFDFDEEPEAATTAASAVAKPPTKFTWLNLLFAGIMFSVAVGLIRLFIGVVAIAKLKRAGVPTTDGFALAELERLRSQLSVHRNVQLLTTEKLTTPATIGWAKPVILLPADFDSWSESELSSAIAHELAHVSSGDFGKNLVAQFAVALNFYNPLVHYLGKELRVAQELAADALAASTTGGRKNYLLTMAEMALQQDSKQLGWLAQPFLPTRKTFLRRIEMLKSNQKLRGIKNAPAIWLARFAVLVFAIGCVGFQFPVVEAVVAQEQQLQAPPSLPAVAIVQQQEEQADRAAGVLQQREPQEKGNERFATDDGSSFKSVSDVPAGVEAAVLGRTSSIASNKLAYVANKTQFFAAIDFDGLSKIESLSGLLKKLSGAGSKGERLFVDLGKLSAATLQVYHTYNNQGRMEPAGGLVLHFRELLPSGLESRGNTFKYRGQTCIESEDSIFFHVVPQSSTLLLAVNRDDLTTMLDSKNGPTVGGWKDVNPEMFRRPIVAAASELGFEFWRSVPNVPYDLRMFSSLWKDCHCAVAGMYLVDGQVRLDGFGYGNDEKAAQSVAETITAGKVVFKNSVLSRNEPFFHIGNQTEQVYRIIKEAVNNISASQDGELVSMKTSARADEQLVSQILSAFTSAVVPFGVKVDNENNLRQIGLAMHNFESAYQKFPPGALTHRPDGPTVLPTHAPSHSWRIAILPFIGENELYKKYKFDERWNSEHNSKVTAKMPDVFRHPSQPRDTVFSSYYVVVGQQTMFPSDGRKISFGNIVDGTSNTILVVEAKRDVHWAKPDDIAYDPDTLAEQMGGFTKGWFSVAMGDGSTATLKKDTVLKNQKTLLDLVKIADGNVAMIEDLKRPSSAPPQRAAPSEPVISPPSRRAVPALPPKQPPLSSPPKVERKETSGRT